MTARRPQRRIDMWNRLRSVLWHLWRRSQQGSEQRRVVRARTRFWAEVHADPENIAQTTGFSIPLYRNGKSAWRQGMDSAGEIDVAGGRRRIVLRAALPG